MNEPSQRRKLAAILAADVAGYSRLIQENDEATVATLEIYRAVFREKIQTHRGRVVDMAGDSVLAVFEAATDAVRAAVEIQIDLSKRNEALADSQQMRFRIGVNLGEVIERPDGTVYGDGVNVAARLEGIGKPGGITVSGNVFDQVKNRLQLAFDYLGEQEVKNIAERIRTYQVVAEGVPVSVTQQSGPVRSRTVAIGVLVVTVVLIACVGLYAFRHEKPPEMVSPKSGVELTLPDKPSIAVLPFQNMSSSVEEEWFADGMTETLITDLSHIPELFVIARNSTFTYKGKAVDVREVGRQLGVKYVLEGSVQRTGERLRVNAQLIDAQTGRHQWAERYDREIADVFLVQDDIISRIVIEMQVKLGIGEQARIWRKTTRNREAYDFFIKAAPFMLTNSREGLAKAQELYQQAIELDPKFAMATVSLGWTHLNQGDAGWSPDTKQSYLKAVELGRRAIEIDPSFGDAYALLSNVYLALERHPEAVAAAEKAISLSPNQADALILGAWALALTGRAQEAIPIVYRAFRLNPSQPSWYYGALGDSLLFAKRTEEAIVAHRNCVQGIPDFIWCQIGLTVDLTEAGKVPDATMQAKEILRIIPTGTAEDNAYVRSLSRAADRSRVIGALRQAGLN